ncbi:uncharacterized protein P174DRAFT_514179 [Aspergillus novofumigatus IBT 16806]|uniref:Uncharacterized protein n=1 Tax=Aspergillus novofumigatus (strain IBT 16806) TaxID=1392255 RepID=A0A2I1C2D3_ASPN1|nr:uncharacterized protein P174DRAFT_514179 [Aspergillus novofumigatus IBT 16806]PKX91753.1 hypothetical protein P174DRAFT_514179 [Aspergillus novofumigatus IBT 16806]
MPGPVRFVWHNPSVGHGQGTKDLSTRYLTSNCPGLTRLLLILALPPVAIGYGIHRGLSALEAQYPPLPLEPTTSIALRTPRNPETQFCAYTDIYAARVPVKALLPRAQVTDGVSDQLKSTNFEITSAWARAFIGNKILRTEGSLVGLLAKGKFSPGDTGDTPAGFASPDASGEPRSLLNGVLVVERPPSEDDRDGLLVSWRMSDEPRRFFEKIARWGYPWRLLSGGRHELSVSEPSDGVRFASAHDYEIVPEEGDLQHQKTIPGWTGRLHRGYARLLLDCAVRELKKEYEKTGSRL